ncbi:MAG: sulfatase [Planctomycetes bacterium]|nr:sulfatase [Planctomycetota bacterium]
MATSYRVSLLLVCGVIASMLAARPAEAQAGKKLNVLFIAVDDLRPDLGCYGNRFVKSPNIDQLVKSGVRFERAYVQFPLCNPSRTSMLNGRYPTTTKVMDNLTYFRETIPDAVPLPAHFRANGYVTARAGKIFHGSIDDQPSWVEGGEPRQQRVARTPQQAAQYRQTSDRWEAVEGEGEELPDYRTASRTIELLEKYHQQPFFIAMGFVKPHSAPVAPKKYFDLYDAEQIPLPVDFAARPKALPGAPEIAIPKTNGDLFVDRDADPKSAREMIRAYYACISFIDAQLARVMKKVDELGLRDNTVIVFWGDHGYHLGEKGKWSKHNSLYEVATRVPLAIYVPGKGGNGQTSPRLVESVDLYPTLAELCGLPQPSGLEGNSLAPLLDDPQTTWRHPAYSVLPRGRAVRTDRWRYVEWEEGKSGAELYDQQNDPYELKNLAADAEHLDTVKQMKELLHGKWNEAQY